MGWGHAESNGPGILGDFRTKVAKEIANEPLAGKYPVVYLHAYRFSTNSYQQSAYSFTEETSDPAKHRNDVQLLFGNAPKGKAFQINMSGGQENAIADLGPVDFEADPDVTNTPETSWQSDQIGALQGHTYLEKIHDSRGNQFCVLIKVLALDPQDRAIAFIWRRLSGGMVVPLDPNAGATGIAGHGG